MSEAPLVCPRGRPRVLPSGPGQLSLAGLNLQRLLCASRRTPHYQLLRSFRPHPVLSARVVADRPAAACGAQSPAQSSSSLPVAGQLHARLAHRVAAVPHALLRPHSLSASRPSATAPANTALRGPVSTPLPQGEREREREREREGRVSPVPSVAVARPSRRNRRCLAALHRVASVSIYPVSSLLCSRVPRVRGVDAYANTQWWRWLGFRSSPTPRRVPFDTNPVETSAPTPD